MGPFFLNSLVALPNVRQVRMPSDAAKNALLVFQSADLGAAVVWTRPHFVIVRHAITGNITSLVLHGAYVEDVTKIVVLEVIGQGSVHVVVVIGCANADVAAEEEKKGVLTRPRSIICFIH